MNNFYLHQLTFSQFLGKKAVWEVIPLLFKKHCRVVWPEFQSQVWRPGVNEMFLQKGCYFRRRLISVQTLVPFLQDVFLSPASFLRTQRDGPHLPVLALLHPGSPRLLLTSTVLAPRHDSFICLMTTNFLVLWTFLLHEPFLKYDSSEEPFPWPLYLLFTFFLVSTISTKTSISAKKCIYIQCNIFLRFDVQLALPVCVHGCPCPCIQLTMEEKQAEKCCVCTEQGETFYCHCSPKQQCGRMSPTTCALYRVSQAIWRLCKVYKFYEDTVLFLT